ncbi:MAG: efflux RND transporter permease subunit [candidate division KSB1 bacterium]|nr:efflux RND transporter permease subunit [candidate division KSB1 bacterium]MDZ7300665.1 efflux RND transporter permease subunit [candidate division KSB1 bacterium]MDZ7309802.1 efflux RND transporter permease subunit [candidate division KSB1 bacterium]
MNLVDISIRRRVTISMFTLAILLFGFVSFFRLKINLLPDLTYPTLTIRTQYTGAAPAEIENLITKPIEEALGVVKNVQQVRSISRSGQSDVMLEFAWGTNMDYASLDVREKLDVLQLPLEAERPAILRFDPSLDPIMRFGFFRQTPSLEPTDKKDDAPQVKLASYTPNANVILNEEELKYLRRFADEQIKKELESVLGVAAVKVSGGLEDEIQVFVDQAKLAQLKLPIEEVARQLGAENINLSGGRLEEGTQQYLVRTLNQFRSVEEIGNVIVTSRNGAPVYVRDFAIVRHGYKEREAITRLNGREAVEMAIYKEGDANTVAVARAVEKRLTEVRKTLPANLELIKVYDQSTFITRAVNEVINAGLVGGILAIIILYFFLRKFATTLIIALSIPVSVIATFNLMYGTDLTLNIMSLGGLALGIGMLVDNSIVVLENISRHREKGKELLAAARDGASEVSMAVTASTLTTVAVFFPLVFVKGIAGQLFRDQALTVTFSLLASLLVALTLIPMLASLGNRAQDAEAIMATPPAPRTRLGRWLRKSRGFLFTTIPVFLVRGVIHGSRLMSRGMLFILQPFLKGFGRSYAKVEEVYPKLLRWALAHRGTVLGIAFTIFFISVLLIPSLGVELIPQLSQGEFRVEFRLPPGTPLERTDAMIAEIQKAGTKIKNITTTFSVAGTGNRLDANPEEGGDNWGELNVMMPSGSKRGDEEITMAQLRTHLERLPGVQYKFSRPTLFSFKTPVEVEVAGFDLDKLKTVSNEIARRMEASPRFADVKSTMEIGQPEIQIYFDRERAAALGLAVHQIADRVVDKIRGEVATRYSYHDRKIDVLVRAREEDRASVEHIRKLIVNPQSDRPVPLEAVANIVLDTGPGEIRRIGQERVALVTANLRSGDLGGAAEEINRIIGQIPTPSGLVVRLGGQNEEMAVSFRSLQFALLLALFLVYLVMASQFESLLHPFVIMFTIPLALVGAVLALLITGSTISVVVFIGLILLAGIVVNNAIVLIDFVNQLRARGMEKMEALVEAGRSRLRPIMMTTLTTVLGLLPLAMGFGEGAEVRAPIAITVIGGLTVSTMLTLVVIPVMYAVMDRRK